MGIADISYTDIDQMLATYPLVILEFWARWSGSTRAFEVTFEEAARQNADIAFLRADIGQEPELAARFEIDSVPVLIGFYNGFPVLNRPGAPSPIQLDKFLEKLRNSDPDELLRREFGLGDDGGATGIRRLFRGRRR